jgi:hypothetical protein
VEREDELAVVGGREHAGVGVEQLHHVGAVGGLILQILAHHVGERREEGAERLGVTGTEATDGAVVAGGPAGDGVGGEGERTAGEADDGRLRADAIDESVEERADEIEVGRHVAAGSFGVRGAVDRVLDDGTDAALDVVVEAEWFEHREDVREHHEAVRFVQVPREEGDALGHLGRLDGLAERVVGADVAVLGDVASGLSHQPDRRPLGPFAAGRADEEVGHGG